MCKNCNIAIGTFYNYFSSKDHLIREIFVSDWEKSIKIIEKIKLSDTTLKEKIYNLYIELDKFISKYISTFYALSLKKGDGPSNHFKIYNEISKLIDLEKQRGTIVNPLDSNKLAQFIIYNFVCLNQSNYMSFEELYQILNL
ncbi:TetR/AcrR family transcriptional regulator [Clostridium botulinum]|uniref:TetR/AcrR family transcriptional regulator n=1 Tax=Clostridium botulinum TaxID=1491 RepID=UPI00019DB920|nr:TetR/AcrR family transcriptional regulator [Clostridium botulinum]AJE09545.1 bacterial regulatory s, tetR family protein [Clostridium botulinum CDC_1436]